ncbi:MULTISPECIES: MFS transporter [unclassified Mesorhizobium]|uniref:MFS transporter n=1 Tax=unclassified Mesorhizobium TaxID=325217 RepID=UPI00086A5ACC|nr:MULTISPECIES: MFS transporter [unclassified Mesorhizobium]MBN9258355.1 MFS transporter [Mesorhizobium sp.]ODT12794.1 MAG: MFS transporter [Mesorhizobium sp. SCN 65-12]OJX73661.1 MAG: MFS transporter [Mesorhizobium sp. 65-26]
MTVSSASRPAASSFPRITLVALVAFAAITPMALLVAPALAAQLATEIGIGPSQIGTYFFVENGAFSAASLLSLFWLGRLNVRVVGLIALAVFILGNLATPMMLPGYKSLLLMRAVTGFGGGTLMVLSMISAQDAENPERVFGYWVVGQLVAGAIGLALLPHLFATYGLSSFYILLGVIALLLSPLYRGFLAPAASEGPKSTSATSGRFIILGVLAVLAILAFYVAIGGVWTFASMAATQAGIEGASVGTILAIASLFGIAGSMLAAFLGGRSARRAMLLLGYAILVASIVAVATLHGSAAYVVAICAFKFAWTFVLPFIIAEAASRDPSGRLVASTTLIIGTGLSLGPLFAGNLLEAAWSLGAVFLAAAICGAVSFACLVVSPRPKGVS